MGCKPYGIRAANDVGTVLRRAVTPLNEYRVNRQFWLKSSSATNVSYAAMFNRIWRLFALLLTFAMTGSLFAQTPAWQHTTIRDPLTGMATEQFVLNGEYLAPPFPQSSNPSAPQIATLLSALGMPQSTEPGIPKLVLSCSDGKLVRHYGLFRGFTPTPTGGNNMLEMVIDAGQKKSTPVTMDVDPAPSIANDRLSYTAYDIAYFVPDIMRGKTVTFVARIDVTGTALFGSAPRQVIMEFTIPDPEPLYQACGTRNFASPQLIPAQLSSWQHTTVKDPLSEKVVERFVLAGEYLTGSSQRLPAPIAVERPRLVLACSNGKLIQHYILSRGLPMSTLGIAGKLDVSVDARTKKSVPISLVMNPDRNIADERNTTFELSKLLAEILSGKTITMVARMDLGAFNGSFSSTTKPQTVMEFEIPSLAPILAVCGGDKTLQGLKP